MSSDQVPTGLAHVDRLSSASAVTVLDYVAAASEYVREAKGLNARQKKTAQIRLSNALGRALLIELRYRLPMMGPTATAGEQNVSGALRVAQADVSEMHPLDGLRLAVELKPVNLAVGRAIWNRFGDIRMTAVNIHLKFPFEVVGGVLTFPTYEEDDAGRRKSTRNLITRAINRLERAGGRRTESEAPHLLEGVGVVVYDPETALIEPDLPPASSPLRWEQFISTLADTYAARFE